MTTAGKLISVNVGELREIERDGELVLTGIWKHPVERRVAVQGVNLAGDDQADRTVHGGVEKAVYSYAIEDYEWWREQHSGDFLPGTFGENLTLRGVDVTAAVLGEFWQIGSTLLEVNEPRFPCWKLGVRMDDPKFLKRFSQALRPGAYLRIVEPGEIGAGDDVKIVDRPDHGVTISLFNRAYLQDHTLAANVLEAPSLGSGWREWFAQR